MSLRLVSVNIERSFHLPLVEDFFARTVADLICVQELMQEDIERVSRALGWTPCTFVPMGIRLHEEPSRVMGIGVFSKVPILNTDIQYYVGEKTDPLPESSNKEPSTYNNFLRPVLTVDVEKAGVVYRIATTHFTWTPDGQANDEQRSYLGKMMSIIEGLGECTLVGDMNAPRGREIFDTIAQKYKDNIPNECTTTIDGTIHRAGDLQLVVDCLFTTPTYGASNVQIQGGVSDHCAILATIDRS